MIMKSRAQELRKRYRGLLEERSTWDGVYSEITDYIVPSRGYREGQKPNDGSKRNGKIIDSVATRALNMFAAGLQSGLNSPARPWFRLSVMDDKNESRYEVRKWLSQCEKVMRNALARSNFYHSSHMVYTELGAYGTAVLFEELDKNGNLNFRTFTNGEYVLASGSGGLVDTVIRKCFFTARQLEQKFGTKDLSRRTKDMLNNSPDAYIDVLHIIKPRDSFDPAKLDNKNMPFESVYLEEGGDGGILSESGYRTFPCMCPRYSVKGADVYGYGAAMDVLPDVKMLQEMNKSMLKAIHKIVEPPMQAPETLKDVLSFVPASVNYIDSDKHDAVRPLYQINYDINAVSSKIADIRQAIREGFFNHLFLTMANNPNMTATEVTQRNEEKLLMLGSVIERVMFEFLDPLVERTFALLLDSGQLPAAPPSVQGLAMRVEYTSLLAQAQKLESTNTISRIIMFAGQMAQYDPQVVDRINPDEALKVYSEAVGGPVEVLRSDDEVSKIRSERAVRQQQQQQMQSLQQMGKMSKDFAGAEVSDNNMLKSVIEGLEVSAQK